MPRMSPVKLIETTSEFRKWQEELVLGEEALGAKDGEYHTKIILVELETLVE